MRYVPIPKDLFVKNRTKLIKKLELSSVAIINSNDEIPRNGDQLYPFRQNSDLYYLTGVEQEKTILVLSHDCPNKKLREVLFIIRPDEVMETWVGHKHTKEEATKISGVENIKYIDEFESVLDELLTYANNIYINTNDYPKFKPEMPSRDLRFAADLKKQYPAHTYKRLAPLVTELRLQKEPQEIDKIKRACSITEGAFTRILKFVEPGVYEYKVEAEITHEFMKNGATSAYQPIVASGKNACVLHYTSNSDKCKDSDLLLMDFGAEYANYAADCSRTIPVNGKFSKKQRDYYEAVLRVQNKAKDLYVVGNTIDNIDKYTFKLMEKELVDLQLISKKDIEKDNKTKSPAFKYLMHGVAHFIGLDVHDVGTKYQPLKPGMILSCEPAMYIKKENTGIRIEDNILVTEKGPVNLTEKLPTDAGEIERLMQK